MRRKDRIKLFVKTVENLKDLLEVKSTDLEQVTKVCPCCLKALKE